jgi:8-hydroxy-5-deazaflavin:NADPH oxidoreductase
MNIAVIGAGNIGGTLTRRLTGLGHHVRVANSRGPQSLAALEHETGAVATHPVDVADGADAVFVALPQKNIPELPPGLLAALARRAAVIDTGNYVPFLRDPQTAALDDGAVESRWTESYLGRPVVNAFNTITAAHLGTLGRPVGAPIRIALPISGDDPSTKDTVIHLADQLGFDGFDAGGLDESWRQQPGTPVYTTDLDVAGARVAVASATQQQTTAWRGRLRP